jgi:hypothetical protein
MNYEGLFSRKAKKLRNYLWGKRRNVTTPGICNCLQGAGDSRDQTGEAYWSYVSQADRGKIWCPVNSCSSG